MKIQRMCTACWTPNATNTHPEYVITYCFSTTTMIALTRLNVTFIRTLTVSLQYLSNNNTLYTATNSYLFVFYTNFTSTLSWLHVQFLQHSLWTSQCSYHLKLCGTVSYHCTIDGRHATTQWRTGGGGFKTPHGNSEDIGGVLNRISKKNRRLDFLL